jgi:hypothetical protein
MKAALGGEGVELGRAGTGDLDVLDAVRLDEPRLVDGEPGALLIVLPRVIDDGATLVGVVDGAVIASGEDTAVGPAGAHATSAAPMDSVIAKDSQARRAVNRYIVPVLGSWVRAI